MSTRDPNPNADLASLYSQKRTLSADESMGLDVFNSAVKGISGERQSRADVNAEKKAQLDREWDKVMTACRTLKERLAGHEKVQAFNLYERGKTVQITFRTPPGKPPYMLTLARDHFNPEHARWTQALWLFRPGNESQQYDSAEALIREFATSLASWTV